MKITIDTKKVKVSKTVNLGGWCSYVLSYRKYKRSFCISSAEIWLSSPLTLSKIEKFNLERNKKELLIDVFCAKLNKGGVKCGVKTVQKKKPAR